MTENQSYFVHSNKIYVNVYEWVILRNPPPVKNTKQNILITENQYLVNNWTII